MGLKKCDYCGKEYDESLFSALDNGSEACFKCVEEEDDAISKREEKNKEKKENSKWKKYYVYF